MIGGHAITTDDTVRKSRPPAISHRDSESCPDNYSATPFPVKPTVDINTTDAARMSYVITRTDNEPTWTPFLQVAWTSPEENGGSQVLGYRVEWFETDTSRDEIQAVRMTWESGDEPFETFR